jgi:hypothetical protein
VRALSEYSKTPQHAIHRTNHGFGNVKATRNTMNAISLLPDAVYDPEYIAASRYPALIVLVQHL